MIYILVLICKGCGSIYIYGIQEQVHSKLMHTRPSLLILVGLGFLTIQKWDSIVTDAPLHYNKRQLKGVIP